MPSSGSLGFFLFYYLELSIDASEHKGPSRKHIGNQPLGIYFSDGAHISTLIISSPTVVFRQ